MPSSIRSLVSKWKKSREDEGPPGLPYPSNPTVAPPPSAALFEAYGLFAKLPPELRQEILRIAFGPGQIHIDLSYDHPRTFFEPVYQPLNTRNRTLATGYKHANVSKRDYLLPKEWQWFSCVCHADLMFGSRADGCLDGWALCTRVQVHGRDRSRCFIGIGGWLRSCWMAYIEGTNMLFIENTIRLSAEVFFKPLSELPRYINSHQLQMIRSLDLRIMFGITLSFLECLSSYQECLRSIPVICPAVKSLHVLLGNWTSPADMQHKGRTATMANLLILSCDLLSRGLPDAQIGVCFDWTLGAVLCDKYGTEDKKAAGRYEILQKKFWRSLDQNNALDAVDRGYWIVGQY